jgi:hypothetical protein
MSEFVEKVLSQVKNGCLTVQPRKGRFDRESLQAAPVRKTPAVRKGKNKNQETGDNK